LHTDLLFRGDYSAGGFRAARLLLFALQKLLRVKAKGFSAVPRSGEKLASKAKRARFSRD
jgi:hypothetical protein